MKCRSVELPHKAPQWIELGDVFIAHRDHVAERQLGTRLVEIVELLDELPAQAPQLFLRRGGRGGKQREQLFELVENQNELKTGATRAIDGGQVRKELAQGRHRYVQAGNEIGMSGGGPRIVQDVENLAG